jgi:hypothetical protein
MSSSFSAIRFCDLGSHTLGPAQRVAPDEPTAVILHGGVSEGGGPARSMETLNGHEAGNGGNGQGNPTGVSTTLLYSAWLYQWKVRSCRRVYKKPDM